MSKRLSLFERLVTALERGAPAPPPPSDWASSPGYRWTLERAIAVPNIGAQPLSELRGIDRQMQAVCDNIERLAQGYAAHDMLLWGARGMGKSALLRAAAADTQRKFPGQLGLIEIDHQATNTLTHLFAELAEIDRAFLLIIDDLGFGDRAKAQMLSLRSALEGGISPRAGNIRIAVTSNRRAIVNRAAGEQDSPLNDRDDRDDALALADRFGLSLGFHPCDRATYLEIVHAYVEPLGLDFDEDEALAWSVDRGSLSGRAAHQFAIELAGRAGKALG